MLSSWTEVKIFARKSRLRPSWVPQSVRLAMMSRQRDTLSSDHRLRCLRAPMSLASLHPLTEELHELLVHAVNPKPHALQIVPVLAGFDTG